MNSGVYWQIVAAVIVGDAIFMFLLMGIATFFPANKKENDSATDQSKQSHK